MDFGLYFKARQGEMIGLLKELVHLESPTSDKRAVDACSSLIVSKFRALGCKATRFPQKDVGDFHMLEWPAPGAKPAEERILVLTHVDTVWPVGKIATMPFFIQGDKLHGPGVLDMKAGLVLAYQAIKTMRDLNRRPGKSVAVFINSAEEIGHAAAHEKIKELSRRSDIVLCLEPALPGGALKIQRKGRLVVRLESSGVAAHAGTPERGVSAVDELNGQLRRLAVLRSREVSMNVGLIGGGEAPNIVPDKAWAVLDFRFWNTLQKAKILAAGKKLRPAVRGGKTKFLVESATPPMERTPASTRLLDEARSIAASLRQTLTTGKAGGGSDASIAAGLGIATLDGLGPDGDGMHGEKEHLVLPSFIQRAALLTELLLRL